jgi:hypothetical protein
MTTSFSPAIFVQVAPVRGKKGWFQLEAIPSRLGYPSVSDWIADLEEEDKRVGRSPSPVKGAKLLGVHDSKEILANDIRFNSATDDEDSPCFAVVKSPDERYYAGMSVNLADWTFFEFIADRNNEARANEHARASYTLEGSNARLATE